MSADDIRAALEHEPQEVRFRWCAKDDCECIGCAKALLPGVTSWQWLEAMR